MLPSDDNVGLMISQAFYGVIDVLSVLPYYLELIFQQDTVRDFLDSVTF